MKSQLSILRLALFLGLMSPWHGVFSQQSVYRCTDSAGNATFQSLPCPGESTGKRLDIEGKSSPSRSGASQGAESRDLRSLGAGGPARSTGESFDKAPTPEPARQQGTAERAPLITTQNTAASPDLEHLSEGADTIVVSGYEFEARSTRLQINHPQKPVLLVLSSYKATQWNVQVAAGTRIKAIIMASYEIMPGPLGNGEFRVVRADLPHATTSASAEFRQLFAALHKRYGVQRVTGFHGAYRLPGVIGVSAPYPNDPNFTLEGVRPEKPRVSMNFFLYSTDGRQLPWTNSGPQGGKRYNGVVSGASFVRPFPSGPIALSSDGVEAYALEGNGSSFRWYPQGLIKPPQDIKLPANLPELSWGSGIAWNAKRGELAIISYGGQGYFYRYDIRQRKWLGARSLEDRDLFGLSIDAASGRYAAMSRALELVIFDETGALDELHALDKVLLDSASVLSSSGSRNEGMSVALVGQLAAVVHVRNGTVTHIWTYDLERRSAQLTYKALD